MDECLNLKKSKVRYLKRVHSFLSQRIYSARYDNVLTLTAAVPAIAPKHWKIMYSTDRITLMRPAINIPIVTAGFT